MRGRVQTHLGDECRFCTKDGTSEARKRAPGKSRGDRRQSAEQRAGIGRKRSPALYPALRQYYALPSASVILCATPPLFSTLRLHAPPHEAGNLLHYTRALPWFYAGSLLRYTTAHLFATPALSCAHYHCPTLLLFAEALGARTGARTGCGTISDGVDGKRGRNRRIPGGSPERRKR